MADISSENLLTRSARGFVNQLGEFVHVSAIYLGIAVLVTLVLSLTVPSLRLQSQQMHAALLATLRPDAMQGGMTGSFAQANDDMLAASLQPEIEEPAPAAGTAPQGSALPPSTPAPVAKKPVPVPKADIASAADFTHALRASADSLSIPNVSKAQLQALRSYIARKYQIAYNAAGVLIKTAFTVGREQHLDPQLLLAVIAIESRYNPLAESHVGAQGLMQVMANVHKDKFARFGGGSAAALNPIANIRVGSQILQDCIKRRGSVEGGLACYVGSTGPGDGGYGAKVLAERRRIALASGIPIGHK
ncbi:transglycosylase SLT domain-containing protein [Paralcaligenes sp. KSB-10]|jgi:soluble lytic murein transglycosylase-like protein|uniref:transglycosylase SLT domain-containing protein n=1 Tax=Paralcaligenes sp. KSB-10 TaxID=2901142 RepID=UPI001E34A03D|nr:transglycosylase SLT domain-containing protein [Paralcaligenes sp. KSB-10]UHL62577.1 transglycosylase SLT domain-containing protein [Paralcaligenes sp. KSB-10]